MKTPDASSASQEATRRVNADVSYAIAEALRAAGVEDVVVAPGSRSTPLVIALASFGFTITVVHDERSAAFFALGLARAREIPAAVVTTSGTATANLFPAIVEASRDCIPMLALTADRPLELLGSGANQTIDQRGLYGSFVRSNLELSADVGTPERAVRARTLEAVRASLEPHAGPVHVNVRFRKPLEIEARMHPCVVAEPLLTSTRSTLASEDSERIRRRIADVQRGLLVIGSLRRRADIDAARQIVDALGWPTHASILSGLRCGLGTDDRESAVPHVDDDAGDDELVIHLGGPTVSTAIDARIARAASVLRVGREARDAEDRAGEHLACDLSFFAASCVPSRTGTREPDVRESPATQDLEAACAVCVATSTRSGEVLFLGNSTPIRDVDAFVPTLPAARVFANRGASGIDGGIASACGIARAHGAPVTALLGDLSFLHDAGSLALAASLALPLRIVVLDNRGGGLFRRLPIAAHEEHDEIFRTCIVAPHEHDLVAIARGFGIRAQRLDALAELRDAVAGPPQDCEVIVMALPESCAS